MIGDISIRLPRDFLPGTEITFQNNGPNRLIIEPASADLIIAPLETITVIDINDMRPGDRIVVLGWPNRYRRRVGRKITGTVYEVKMFIRPSRGYARHVRNQKQQRRRHGL